MAQTAPVERVATAEWEQLGSNTSKTRCKIVIKDARNGYKNQQAVMLVLALGARGPRFESGRPDQKYLACFLLLIESAVHLKPRLRNSGRQECLIRKSFSFLEFAT